ncbi:hypothetical protein Aasi_1488 [Candidatus Amoebophilus asiaticus 5a2]|uniref:Uncharacterized protein n=1 Tax=Amoebophilus asiaticus (strain 5a2) TaxID=452471 RepID=C3L4D8_AMOA5|nr:hypothetical protein [Candidatus Amoebophilus asiaticus]ACP20855.1 hypothetical protein Aasi_1488 [Candidatus Amoebophilus asiaticus 5a2]
MFLLLLSGSCQACKENEQKADDILDSENYILAQSSPQEQQANIDSSATSILIQESYALAADLNGSNTLMYKYQDLKTQIGVKPGKNSHPTFVSIDGIKKALRHRKSSGEGDLKKFVSWAETGDWKQFGPSYQHYDGWMFPIDRISNQGLKYTVFKDDIQQLKADLDWLKDYRLGAILLIQSWGWDIKRKKNYTNPTAGQRWRKWDVRLGKLANSLILFEQWDLYGSLKSYVNYLMQSGVKLEGWVLGYFPNK